MTKKIKMKYINNENKKIKKIVNLLFYIRKIELNFSIFVAIQKNLNEHEINKETYYLIIIIHTKYNFK